MKVTGPLFKWFGSKWLSSRLLPEPTYDRIVEPFAGSAGYSLRHCEHSVELYEKDEYAHDLWYWLINQATETRIREIPINLKEGTDIRDLGMHYGQELLLKNWQRTNNVGDCWTISPWGNKPGQWTENTRARIAEEFQAIRHWKVMGHDGIEAFGDTEYVTWMIDPPYEYNYQYKARGPLDYTELAMRILRVNGQKIVCEAACQKTGVSPNWLPFQIFGHRITSRRKEGMNVYSKELIWTNG